MFSRPEQNYDVPDETLDGILSDPAQPLARIAALVEDGSYILDVGAGNGLLARVLSRAGKNVVIDGVEPNEFAAQLAAKYYRHFYPGFVQEHLEKLSQTTYDYVVLADVIEHMPNPLHVLTELLDKLPSETRLIVSVPNVAFGAVRLGLMNGQFHYVDSGLLEHTHLRFFTRSSLTQLFGLLGLKIDKYISLERSFYRTEFARKDISASFFSIIKLALNNDARAYQYLFLLSKKNSDAVSGEAAGERVGASAFNILLDYLFARPVIRSVLRRLRG